MTRDAPARPALTGRLRVPTRSRPGRSLADNHSLNHLPGTSNARRVPSFSLARARREWSLLVPAYGMVLVLLTYAAYFALALAGTPAFADMRTITGESSSPRVPSRPVPVPVPVPLPFRIRASLIPTPSVLPPITHRTTSPLASRISYLASHIPQHQRASASRGRCPCPAMAPPSGSWQLSIHKKRE